MSIVSFSDAADRQIVRLPDGREGVLIWVSPNSHVARVRCAGRHVRIPVSELHPTGECAR